MLKLHAAAAAACMHISFEYNLKSSDSEIPFKTIKIWMWKYFPRPDAGFLETVLSKIFICLGRNANKIVTYIFWLTKKGSQVANFIKIYQF